jgi:Flp pilus assembly protein TadG
MNKDQYLEERAEATIQSVVVVPIIFLIVFMCFHLGSLFHQTHVAHLAATRGATVASSMNLSSDSVHRARAEIERVIADLDSRLATAPVISYRDRGVQVEVALRASTAISFLPSLASATAWRPLESFRLEQDRQ